MPNLIRILCLTSCFIAIAFCKDSNDLAEKEHGVTYASKCETCKYLAMELTDRLSETGKTSEVLEIGYSLDDVKTRKRKEYKKSELRLLESLENICDRLLQYNLHKERTDSTRFAKGMSQTFETLHGLVNKGVKVDLGIPYDLWDKPPVEVVQMKTQCEFMIEEHDENIEDWYMNQQDNISLVDFLCRDRVLKKDDQVCLEEKIDENAKGDSGGKKEKTKKEEVREKKEL
ncbi:CNPY3 family protein [Megaselia abdita]